MAAMELVCVNDLGARGNNRMHLLVWLINPVAIKGIQLPDTRGKEFVARLRNFIVVPSEVLVLQLPASTISRNDIRWWKRPDTCPTLRRRIGTTPFQIVLNFKRTRANKGTWRRPHDAVFYCILRTLRNLSNRG